MLRYVALACCDRLAGALAERDPYEEQYILHDPDSGILPQFLLYNKVSFIIHCTHYLFAGFKNKALFKFHNFARALLNVRFIFLRSSLYAYVYEMCSTIIRK